MFGSSGIRGVANQDLNSELAVSVGLAVGARCKSAVIGRDPRIASEMIEFGLISGLIACECDVTRIGLVSTPTLAHAARNFDCGIMVTASHNPPEYVGIKLWNPDGTSFNSKQQKDVESSIAKAQIHPTYTGNRASWDAIGKITSYENAIDDHKREVLRHFDQVSCRVVVDCGSGAGATVTPYVLRAMGCDVITLNAQLDGFFPARNPEPIESNLNLLKKAVRSFHADIGIAHDGDADRMMAIDRGGAYITGDELFTLFGIQEAKKMAVCPVDVSRLVDDVLTCPVRRTRVGDVYVAEEVKQSGADFGGESSGSWIFPRVSFCPDGIYAAARIVAIAAEHSLSEQIAQFPTYHVLRGAYDYRSNVDPMVSIAQEFDSLDYIKITTIDGIRLDFEEGWILARKSGTEPKLRLTAEARDLATAKKLYGIGLAIVKRHVQC